MCAGCKSGRGQRSREEIAVVNRQTDDIAVAAVEIGKSLEERLGLAIRRGAETIDVMMTVAFGMGHADQRAKRQILLHTKAGLAGEILAGDEMVDTLRAPRGSTGR